MMKKGLENWDPKTYTEVDQNKPPMDHEEYAGEGVKEFVEFLDFFNPMRVVSKLKEFFFLVWAFCLLVVLCATFWLTGTSWEDLEPYDYS